MVSKKIMLVLGICAQAAQASEGTMIPACIRNSASSMVHSMHEHPFVWAAAGTVAVAVGSYYLGRRQAARAVDGGR